MPRPAGTFRRLLLLAMLASVTVCAVVAVVTFLSGSFTPGSVRIMLTLGTLAMHCGVALSLFTAIDKGLHETLANIGLAAFGGNLAVCLAAIWFMQNEWGLRALGGTLALSAYYSFAAAHGKLIQARIAPGLAAAGLAASVAGYGSALYVVWFATDRSGEWTWKSLWLLLVASFTLAHVALLLTSVTAPSLSLLRLGAVLAAVGMGGLLTYITLWPDSVAEDSLFRLLGATGVVDAAMTLAAMITQRLRAGEAPRPGEAEGAAAPRVSLTCPRCAKALRLDLGQSRCDGCGLDIEIRLPNLLCKSCGYRLLEVAGRQCPECGAPF